jgi:5-(carboxyamino)imidazole ribonucleotide synthase
MLRSVDQDDSPPTVGIVGAGQLARMTYQAAIPLGLRTRVLATAADESAALVARDLTLGAPTCYQALEELASMCDVLTFDHELVEVTQLEALEAAGHRVRPSAATVGLAQNKLRQREELGALGLPVPAFQALGGPADLLGFANQQGWPVVVKAIRGGYDGRGVWVVNTPTEGVALLDRLGAHQELLVETWVPIERELAILVVRRPAGQTVVYPLVETVQVAGICREVLAPAPVAPKLAEQAKELALRVAAASSVVGVLAVELFETGGRLVINELAARPHNSGHYSIEGCISSQFENHLRAVLDWPLGETDLRAPAVATVNLLGGPNPVDLGRQLPRALAVPGAHVHLYGKGYRPGRKLGHVTALGADRGQAQSLARRAAELLVEPARS